MWWAGKYCNMYMYVYIYIYVSLVSILWRFCWALKLCRIYCPSLSFWRIDTQKDAMFERSRYTFSKVHHCWYLSGVDKRFDFGFAKEGGEGGTTRNVYSMIILDNKWSRKVTTIKLMIVQCDVCLRYVYRNMNDIHIKRWFDGFVSLPMWGLQLTLGLRWVNIRWFLKLGHEVDMLVIVHHLPIPYAPWDWNF